MEYNYKGRIIMNILGRFFKRSSEPGWVTLSNARDVAVSNKAAPLAGKVVAFQTNAPHKYAAWTPDSSAQPGEATFFAYLPSSTITQGPGKTMRVFRAADASNTIENIDNYLNDNKGLYEGNYLKMREATPDELKLLRDAVSSSKVGLGSSVERPIIANSLGFDVPAKRGDQYTDAESIDFKEKVGTTANGFPLPERSSAKAVSTLKS
jgi:hypothetical protein